MKYRFEMAACLLIALFFGMVSFCRADHWQQETVCDGRGHCRPTGRFVLVRDPAAPAQAAPATATAAEAKKPAAAATASAAEAKAPAQTEEPPYARMPVGDGPNVVHATPIRTLASGLTQLPRRLFHRLRGCHCHGACGRAGCNCG